MVNPVVENREKLLTLRSFEETIKNMDPKARLLMGFNLITMIPYKFLGLKYAHLVVEDDNIDTDDIQYHILDNIGKEIVDWVAIQLLLILKYVSFEERLKILTAIDNDGFSKITRTSRTDFEDLYDEVNNTVISDFGYTNSNSVDDHLSFVKKIKENSTEIAHHWLDEFNEFKKKNVLYAFDF